MVATSARKSPRDLAPVDYADTNLDQEIFCHSCAQWVVPPCLVCGDCGMLFVDPQQLGLEVVKSQISGAGEGLFNNGPTIPKGTMVGPYTGKFISYDDYKKLEKRGGESGYAWMLYDSATMDKPLGFIDPGSDPNPKINILSKANHPPKKYEQSFMGCQFNGQIFYR